MLGSLDNAYKNQTNWLMPIGARGCSLNIQTSSSLVHLTVLVSSNFGVHHSSTEIIMFVVMPFTLKVVRYWGYYSIFLYWDFVLIHLDVGMGVS